MAIASANRESLLYKVEVTEGTNPAGAATYLNFTNNSLNVSNETTNSNIVRSDTNIAGTIRTGLTVTGDIGVELQYAELDPFLEAVLRGTYATSYTDTATTISFANSDNSVNDSGAGFGDVQEGQWLKISGTTSGTNDGWFKVATKSSTSKLILSHGTVTDETAGESITLKGQYLENATTEKSFTFERVLADITQYQLFTGMKVNTLNLNFNTSDLAGGSLSLIGRNGAYATSSGFSGSHTAASTSPSMNTVNDIKAIYVNGALSTADFASLDFSITTNAEALRAIGSLTNIAVNQRSIGVSGNFTVFKEDKTFDDFKRNFTAIDLAIVTEDSNGDGYVWDFPQVYITDGSNNNQGVNTDLQDAMSFTAVLDPTQVATASVTKYT